MKARHWKLLFAGVALAAIVAGLMPDRPKVMHVWYGAAKDDPSWQFTYSICRLGGVWQGRVEHRTESGLQTEKMDIYDQTKDTIAFRTGMNESGKPSPHSWHLRLIKGPDGMIGTLTRDDWDSKAARLFFTQPSPA